MSQKPTFNDKLAELEALVAWFSSEDITVEQALEKYQKALELTEQLEESLKIAEQEVKIIKQNSRA